MRQFFNPYPKYLQVRRILLERIEVTMRVGEQLPTEHALCAEFSVSRETIRSALAALEQDGIIERTRGRGTFVARTPLPRREQRLTGLSEDFTALRGNSEARVLQAGPAQMPPVLREQLSLDAAMPLFRIERLRMFEREPFAWHDAWLPLDLGQRIADLDLSHTFIAHELRETLRLSLFEDQHVIDAVAADIDVARLLDVPIGAPLLGMNRLYLMQGGGLAVYFRSLYRSDRYYYTVKLAQSAGTAAARKPAARRPNGA